MPQWASVVQVNDTGGVRNIGAQCCCRSNDRLSQGKKNPESRIRVLRVGFVYQPFITFSMMMLA